VCRLLYSDLFSVQSHFLRPSTFPWFSACEVVMHPTARPGRRWRFRERNPPPHPRLLHLAISQQTEIDCFVEGIAPPTGISSQRRKLSFPMLEEQANKNLLNIYIFTVSAYCKYVNRSARRQQIKRHDGSSTTPPHTTTQQTSSQSACAWRRQ
jgi:hypothetical protein